MIFSPSIATLMAGAGVLKGMGYTEATFASNGGNSTPVVTVAATIYSGIQPSAAAITSSWASYNTNFLFHQPGISIIQLNYSSLTNSGGILEISGSPTAVTAANNGTASWAILWCSNVAAGSSAGQISNATIPNVNFIVGPVTLTASNGMLTMANLSSTSGNSISVSGLNLTFNI